MRMNRLLVNLNRCFINDTGSLSIFPDPAPANGVLWLSEYRTGDSQSDTGDAIAQRWKETGGSTAVFSTTSMPTGPLPLACLCFVTATTIEGFVAWTQSLRSLLKSPLNNVVAKQPLWFVTVSKHLNGSQVEANAVEGMVRGFARGLFCERPQCRGGVIQCHQQPYGPQLDDIVALLTHTHEQNRDDLFRLTRQQWFCQRIADPVQPAVNIPPESFITPRQERTLLIGGSGDIGRHVTGWLLASGVKHLIVTGRRSEHEVREWLVALHNQYPQADISYLSLDVTDRDAVERATIRIDNLISVFYLAGVIADGLFQDLDLQQWQAVVNSKVMGAVNIDRATRGRPLQQFVLFSSSVVVTGKYWTSPIIWQPMPGWRVWLKRAGIKAWQRFVSVGADGREPEWPRVFLRS